MSDKKRLLDSLFSNEKREHVNIKFFRAASADNVTVEAFCAAVNKTLFLVDNGLVVGSSSFSEDLVQIYVTSLNKN